MSLLISGAGEVRSAIERLPEQPATKAEPSHVKAIIDLTSANFHVLGKVQRSGSIERVTIGYLNGPPREAELESAVKLPARGARAVLTEELPRALASAPLVYHESLLGERQVPVFTRRGAVLGALPAVEVPPQVIVSGVCLFGSAGMVAELKDGSRITLTDARSIIESPVHKLQVATELSLYEVEAIERLSALMQEAAKLNPSVKRFSVQVPREEYMLYLLGSKVRGLLNQDQYEQGCQAVEDRAGALERYLATTLRGPIQLSIMRPLQPLAGLIRSGSFENENAAIAALSSELRAAYPEQCKLLDELPKVKAINQINYRGYALGYVLTPERSALAVENFSEEAIARSLSDKKCRRFLEAQGRTIETLYCYEGLLPVTGEITLVDSIAPASIRYPMPALPPINLEQRVPQVDYLFFSGLTCSAQLGQLLMERYNQGGMK